jgi:hypothetical protein
MGDAGELGVSSLQEHTIECDLEVSPDPKLFAAAQACRT